MKFVIRQNKERLTILSLVYEYDGKYEIKVKSINLPLKTTEILSKCTGWRTFFAPTKLAKIVLVASYSLLHL